MRQNFNAIQEAIRASGVDAWALYDFRGTNDLAWTILGIDPDAHCTRRWMVVVPPRGHAIKLMHKMEQDHLKHIHGVEHTYATREEWNATVREVLAPFKTIAMEYSPMGEVPVVSKVDAGIVELIRSFGVNVVSSGDLSQNFTAVLSDEQLAGAEVTAGQLRDVIHDAFRFVKGRLTDQAKVSEYEVQRFILSEFERLDLETDSAPIVAIGTNAARPHYAPTVSDTSEIGMNMVLLIDAWAKRKAPGSVFADLTWVAYTGSEVPSDVESTFKMVTDGRDAAIDLVQNRFASGSPVFGYEVDRVCRDVIDAGGMGSNFIHRTGHNITSQIHGPGVNMDDFETRDTRPILKGMTFSIEPGIYIEETLGLRSEIDVVVHHDGSVNIPSAPVQQSVLALFAEA